MIYSVNFIKSAPNPQETANLVTFTAEILNRKLHFLCSGSSQRTNHFKNIFKIVETQSLTLPKIPYFHVNF